MSYILNEDGTVTRNGQSSKIPSSPPGGSNDNMNWIIIIAAVVGILLIVLFLQNGTQILQTTQEKEEPISETTDYRSFVPKEETVDNRIDDVAMVEAESYNMQENEIADDNSFENKSSSQKSLNDIRFSNFRSKDWYDNEYIRALRYYLSRYCAKELSNPNLDPYRQIIPGDFVLYKIEPFILGGAFIQFVFFKKPEKLFTSWVYSEVDEERQVVLSYEVRDVRAENEDTGLSQDDILRIMSEHPELKFW